VPQTCERDGARASEDAEYSDLGRSRYMYRVFNNTVGAIAQITGTPLYPLDDPLDVPGRPIDRATVDFARVAGNPVTGSAAMRLGLAQPDRVIAGVYDLAGRRVRTLADARFEAGEHVLVWDGNDDAGRRVRPGVYLARVRYEARGFSEVMKLTILR
jgi:hypothetical protein